MRFLLQVSLVLALSLAAQAEEAAPYAGQEQRSIKALAPERVDGLRAGAGLGYAKAAELNGWPGPLHALELADELALTAEQVAAIESERQAMLARVIPLGEAVIAAETELDALFAQGHPETGDVDAATARIGALEAELRAAHLNAHLSTAPLLTKHQIMLYNRARGYGGGATEHGQHGGHH